MSTSAASATTQGTAPDIAPTLDALTAIARRLGDRHVGSEQLALLALPGPDGIEAMAREAGRDPAPIERSLETCCGGSYPGDEADIPPVTVRTHRMVERAAELAALDGSPEIGSVHLAATLLAEPNARAWRGLREARVGFGVLLDGLERRRPRWLSVVTTSTPQTACVFIERLGSALLEWSAAARRRGTLDEPTPAEVACGVEVMDLFLVAARLGHLTRAEIERARIGGPREAFEMLRDANRRIGRGIV